MTDENARWLGDYLPRVDEQATRGMVAELSAWRDEQIDLDALNWLPNWEGLNATDPERLERRMRAATAGDAWVVAGSYTKQSQATFWPRLQTIVWLDLPMPLLVYRVIVRSWRRWRDQQHLWGTNYENFWRQLMVWRGEDSLIWWILNLHYDKRRRMYQTITDPAWAHVNVVRLRTPAEVEALVGGFG